MPGSPHVRRRNAQASTATRSGRTWTFSGMVHGVSRPRSKLIIKILIAASLTALCMFILHQYDAAGTVDMGQASVQMELMGNDCIFSRPCMVKAIVLFVWASVIFVLLSLWKWSRVNLEYKYLTSIWLQKLTLKVHAKFSMKEDGITHVLVTGGAGFIGSHATLRLLQDGYRVTIVDNLSRGNMGAVDVLRGLAKPDRLQFLYVDLGDSKAVNDVFAKNALDAVMHFAAVAYVGESMAEPLRYYHNITLNTLVLLETMVKHKVHTLIYSSTCATYGEPEVMPIKETTVQVPINPYGKAKKMAEDIIFDYVKSNSELAVMVLRYFNVIGSDSKGRLGEAPRPELRAHGRISGACFDAAMGQIAGLKVHGTDYKTLDGTCIRDYIHVTDLVDAHVKALKAAKPAKPGVYNVGTGKGKSVREFVQACKDATGVNMTVTYLDRRPGDYAEVYSDPSKIKRDLNWTAEHLDLTQTLRVAWNWRRAHPNGYQSASIMRS